MARLGVPTRSDNGLVVHHCREGCSEHRILVCHRIAAPDLVNGAISERTCGAAFLQVFLLASSCGNRWRAQAMYGRQDAGEQITTDSNLSELEGNGAGVTDDP